MHILLHQTRVLAKENWVSPTEDSLLTLALLRTCKQIYAEAVGYVYRKNTLALESLIQFKHVPPQLGQNLQHLWMRVCLLFVAQSNQIRYTSLPQAVYSWVVKYRKLRSFTFNILRTAAEFNELILLVEERNPCLSNAMTALQLHLRPREKDWEGVQRRLELCVGQWEGLSLYDPYPALEKLSCWWGWDLWINGQLCYKDGKRILRPFELTTQGWQTMVGGEEEQIF